MISCTYLFKGETEDDGVRVYLSICLALPENSMLILSLSQTHSYHLFPIPLFLSSITITTKFRKKKKKIKSCEWRKVVGGGKKYVQNRSTSRYPHPHHQQHLKTFTNPPPQIGGLTGGVEWSGVRAWAWASPQTDNPAGD